MNPRLSQDHRAGRRARWYDADLRQELARERGVAASAVSVNDCLLPDGDYAAPQPEPLVPIERETVEVVSRRKAGFPDRYKRAILARDRNACANCGNASWEGEPIPIEIDHVDPHGPHSVENGQALCRNCHGIKSRREARARSAAGEPLLYLYEDEELAA